MVSSSRQIFIDLLLLLSAIVSAHAQSAVDKASTSSISGKVTIGGKGASGLVVGLATETPSSSIQITGLKAVTDEDGNYRIRNVPPGTYKVLVAVRAYVQSDGPTPVIVGKNEVAGNIDVTLVRGGVITGKVIDANGRPVLEEEVFFSLTTPSRAFPWARPVRTDDRGVYRGFGLPAGRYLVSAGKDSLSSFARRANTGHPRTYHPSAVDPADATVIQVNEGSEVTNVDITLGRQLREYTARGRIIDGETSQPLPNAHIGIQLFFDIKVHGGTGYTSKTNAAESTKDGEFKIENLPPGKYAVYLDSLTESESSSEQVRFEITDQDIEGLLIKTSNGATVSGVVVLEGSHDPTVKANLGETQIVASVSTESYGKPIPSVNINPNGSFRLTGLSAGRLMLDLPRNRDRLRLMRIERDGVAYPGGIEIKEREQITGLRVVVSQANGKIRGLLKLPDDFELPATARLRVSIRRTEDSTVNDSTVEADARGQFLVENLVPGTYEFNVGVVDVPKDQRPRIMRPTQTVVVTNGAIADVTITLQTSKTDPGKP
jgi:Carboxypeptidase regulatory-like domain